MAAVPRIRETMNAWWPARTSRTRNGDASIAWYCRVHLIALRTGQLDSKDAARLDGRPQHRRRGEEPRCDELEVVVGVPVDRHVLHELAQTPPQREEVDDRRYRARDDGAAPNSSVLSEEELERADGECDAAHWPFLGQ